MSVKYITRPWVWFYEKAKLSPERHFVMVLSLAALLVRGLLVVVGEGGVVRGFLETGLEIWVLSMAGSSWTVQVTSQAQSSSSMNQETPCGDWVTKSVMWNPSSCWGMFCC